VNSSISRRLVFWLAVPLTLLALCGVLVHYFNELAPQVIAADQRLKAAAAELSARLQAGAATASVPGPADPALRFALRDAAGKLLGGDGQLPGAGNGAATPVYATVVADHRTLRLLSLPVRSDAGTLRLTVADELKTNQPAARYSFMSTLLWDFVQLDLTLVLVWVGIQLGLRPVKRLRDEIAERSPLDLRPIVETSVPREIAPLAATLNRLFLTLRTATQAQQQFIANTAHQLRTPITGMLAQLDLLLAEPDAQPVKDRLATLQEGVRQLAHSANQLLSLARADPALNAATRRQPVDLRKLAGDAVAKFFDRALQLNIDLGAELEAAEVLADASLIDDLLGNLIDNALKYTPPGGRVTVSSGRRDGKAFLSVEDNGPGIPEADRQRVRQRFYRLPNSPGHGSGLGLAIVEEIARLYEGELLIESAAVGPGARLEVRFPGAPDV
jgi:two-component system sensor histidine kinase TctE